jgi:hypothetical protein
LAESIESSFTFFLLTEIELAVRALLASPLDLKPVFRLKQLQYLLPLQFRLLLFLLEERIKTSKKVASSNSFKSSAVAFPNRILEALIDFSFAE